MTTWREERRQDRLNEARIAREAEEGRAKIRSSERKGARDARERRRLARSARRANTLRWCASHAVNLMLAPVILASLALSWTGMATYGTADYGMTGVILPVLSEGGAWAFAFSAARMARTGQDHKLWSCRLGILVFAGYGAALNFLHGYTRSGVTVGLTMALVSVAGITAHQLLTAGPQRSLAERRARAAERAATRRAKVEFDGSGSARLVHEPGVAVMARRHGRVALMLEPAKPQAELQIEGSPEPAPELPAPVPAEPVAVAPENSQDEPSPSVPVEPPATLPAEPPQSAPHEPPDEPASRPRQTRRRQPPRASKPKTDTVTALIKAGVSNTEIVRRTGVSLATVKRRRSAFKAAGGNVVSIGERRQA